MKIEDTWKSLDSPLSSEEITRGLRSKPVDVLRKLNKRLWWKIAFTILFTPLYVAMVFYLKDWLPQLLFAIMAVSHIIGLVFFVQRYRKAKQLNMATGNVVETLKLYAENVRSTIRLEELSGLVLYPIAGSAGFFFSLLEEMSFQEALNDQRTWIVLLISILVITPLAHLLARWMNRKTFSKLLKQLDDRINELELD